MKRLSVLAIVAIVVGIASSCDSKKSVSFKTEIDTVSYFLGASYGHGLKEQFKQAPGDPINIDALIKGFVDGAESKDSIFTLFGKSEQDMQSFVNGYFQKAMQDQAQKTKEEGEVFLASNKTKSGVISTESGLQYKVLTEGTGIKPTLEDTVLVHYTGKFLDGTVFDSSVQRGEPIKFPVQGVIQGWSEGVQLMPKGSKYMFWIPYNLAYGEQGNQIIKPNSTLEFEVELLDVLKKK
ncbi:MAG: FKBP-type peptidyl-prolyl cis-trans isomerase [Tannerella sp.]|jgi:FKBP-type peptidyl-prolyl cis-trans isomerase FkpA/FKBP-type peptidyl-prolyl cis-trans isomerase FklB|nr:FKBP-type peptidyl-prolyl cis-trans isomerase [Tannerella sp.]